MTEKNKNNIIKHKKQNVQSACNVKSDNIKSKRTNNLKLISEPNCEDDDSEEINERINYLTNEILRLKIELESDYSNFETSDINIIENRIAECENEIRLLECREPKIKESIQSRINNKKPGRKSANAKMSNEITNTTEKRCSRQDCSGKVELDEYQGLYACSACGRVESYAIAIEKQTYGENQRKQKSLYKRENHLLEILIQFQAKENTDPPKEVIDKVRNYLRRIRLKVKDLEYGQVRGILKKLKLNRYYDKVSAIYQYITRRGAPKLSKEVMDKIVCMFHEVQKPFGKYCKKTRKRKNFLNYAFFLNKVFNLLGYKHIAKYFPLLKHKNKLKKHIKTWKYICKYLNWFTV